jgi:hypothetical protein
MAICRSGNSEVNRFAVAELLGVTLQSTALRGLEADMKTTKEEQQKRSEHARLKAYYARRRRKRLKEIPKQKQGGFKNMRLVNKSKGKAAKNSYVVKITKLPPGEAQGARDLQRWAKSRRG